MATHALLQNFRLGASQGSPETFLYKIIVVSGD